MRARKQVVAAFRRTVGYVRVSTDEQAENGVSLAAQGARINAYCTAMGWGIAETVRDAGTSAKSLQRSGMDVLLERVKRNEIERIVVAKLDRLTRSVRDLADLIDLCSKHDVALVSVGETIDTGSAAGRLVVNMIATVAQWEREAIAERTATALAHKRQNGTAYATTPFGYRREGHSLVPDPQEQAALEEAIRMDLAGASFREIAKMLTARGTMPHRGKAWHASSVRAVLRSKIVSEGAA